MNDPRGRQARFNAESRDQWDGFSDHRRRVSALLGAGLEPRPSRLCVLGAGNGNDLELGALLKAHREVHLVDLDREALARGAEGQGVSNEPRLHLHGGLDVTGMLDAIARWSPRATISYADLMALVDWPAARVSLALSGPFDLVASTCLLSQIVGNAFCSVGEGHPRFLDVVRAIRRGHIRLLIELARPGGMVVLITDVVSTDRHPTLGSVPEASLPDFLKRLARDGGLIHGMSPTEIMALFQNDPMIAPDVAGLETIPPWRWKLHQRQYLVWAIRCRIGEKN
jgi:hypothetical protein